MYKPKTILIIDDSSDIRLLLKIRLEMAKFAIIEAENGKTGFLKAIKNIPDLIITDYSMPEMNGLDAASLIKNNFKTKHIPIILLSSFPFGKDLFQKMEEIKIDAYMMKPYEVELLYEKIFSLLSIKKEKNDNKNNEKTSTNFKEKRMHKRFEISDYTSVNINGKNYRAKITDISHYGIRIKLPVNSRIGQEVNIKFEEDFYKAKGKALIKWIKKDTSSENFLAGLEIQSMKI